MFADPPIDNQTGLIDRKIPRVTPLHSMQLLFVETEIERTQEFTIRWSPALGGPTREIVRQQWTFSPQGSTREAEQYDVSLDGVAVLELSIKPNLDAGRGRAT